MGSTNPRGLIHRSAGAGLKVGSGQTVDLDLNELPEEVIAVATDYITFITAAGLSKKEAVADLIALITGNGLAAASGVIGLDLDSLDDAAAFDPATDTLSIIDKSVEGHPSVLVTVADFVAAIRGTAATTGITSSGGVLAALIKLVHLVADEKSALFYEAAEIDFGTADAVDTKISDAIAAKGKLIAVQAVVTEAFNGDADNTITISSAASGNTAMCSSIIVDKDAGQGGNYLGASFGVIPNSDNSEIVASGGDVYAYRAANANCTSGKLRFLLWFMKTA